MENTHRDTISGARKRKSGRVALAAGALALTLAAPAMAREAGWYVGVEGGASSVEDAESTSTGGDGAGGDGGCLVEIPGVGCVVPDPAGGGGDGASQDSELRFDDGTGFSLTVGRQFRNSGWRPELGLSWLQNDLESVALPDGTVTAADGELTALSLMANVWYDFELPWGLVPYVGGGVGGRQLEFSSDDGDGGSSDSDDTVFGYQLGTGLGWQATDRLTIGLDYRYLDGNDASYETSDGGELESEFQAQTLALSARWLFLHYPPPDGDGDGVPDLEDDCRDTPSGAPVDARGCALDADGDGVIDPDDDCPGTASGVSVDDDGCPLDSDGDGVTDDKDRCPDTAPGTEVDSKGCARDRDGDGVPDAADDCPNTPAGTEVTSNGCAAGQAIELKGVEFATDSAELTGESEAILQDVAGILRDSTGFRVEVQGHTDNLGSSAYNQRLSQRRAEAVRDYLIDQGIAGDRLEAVGYGESQPKVPNTDDANRQRNRRVELEVLGN